MIYTLLIFSYKCDLCRAISLLGGSEILKFGKVIKTPLIFQAIIVKKANDSGSRIRRHCTMLNRETYAGTILKACTVEPSLFFLKVAL